MGPAEQADFQFDFYVYRLGNGHPKRQGASTPRCSWNMEKGGTGAERPVRTEQREKKRGSLVEKGWTV